MCPWYRGVNSSVIIDAERCFVASLNVAVHALLSGDIIRIIIIVNVVMSGVIIE